MPALKQILLGKPLSSEDEGHQRLRKSIALPVFSSDAISSTAYATDEMLHVLLYASVGALAFTKMIPIAIVVCVLMLIVITSYRQTIFAYPSGGGSYVVSRENLGELPSLVAASALLVDYILTVAVSVSGGVLALRTATGMDTTWTVPLALVCVFIMTVVNLRGVKESGAAFAGPTYFYVLMLLILIGTGLYRVFVQGLGPIPDELLSEDAIALSKEAQSLGLFMLLRAFSSGAVALSGIEAVSNGVPSFQKPESKNAAITLVWMGGIMGTCFLGVSILAAKLKPYRATHDGNGLGLMAEHIYGGKGVLFWMLLIGTFLILILAANTAYNAFPALASIVAKDGFLPRQFFNRGSRLVFSNGVIFLAGMAGALIVAFDGNISALIPLYAFGVFTGFTLSQSGMVRHHIRHKESRWRWKTAISAIGTFVTGLIALVVVVSKFDQGAWIPAVLIPLIVVGFRSIGKHYTRSRAAIVAPPGYRAPRETHTMVVLVGGVNKGVLRGVQYARSLNPDRILAVTVCSNDDERKAIEAQWKEFEVPIELHTVFSPYRELTRPVLQFIDELDDLHQDNIITVVIPENVTSWGTQWLHNGSAFALKAKLLYRPHTAVVSVPIHTHGSDTEEQ